MTVIALPKGSVEVRLKASVEGVRELLKAIKRRHQELAPQAKENEDVARLVRELAHIHVELEDGLSPNPQH
jgi:hypothetical protein